MKISFTTAKEVLGLTDSDIELLISVVNREARHWADLKAQVDRERYPTTGQLVVESAASWAALLAKLEEID